jgi:hypothetical protein
VKRCITKVYKEHHKTQNEPCEKIIYTNSASVSLAILLLKHQIESYGVVDTILAPDSGGTWYQFQPGNGYPARDL